MFKLYPIQSNTAWLVARGNKGRTSGSRIMFISEKHEAILLHKPHPQKELKAYQVKQLIEVLEQEGLI